MGSRGIREIRPQSEIAYGAGGAEGLGKFSQSLRSPMEQREQEDREIRPEPEIAYGAGVAG